MPPTPSDPIPTLSILDRLVDDAPAATSEAVAARADRARILARMKESVQRDLEWLLNTKQSIVDRPPGLAHLDRSLLAYGLPDFSASSLDDGKERDRLLRAVEEAIRRFEPRLAAVRARLEEGRDTERSLRFRIDALLRLDPDPEAVSFDSTLNLGTKAFVVREA
ncbi:type VI secretion system baseplate subunit TssE [Tundrisphaera sp. TA3]|uniref:type VI secretion system baseplate subunit TssE n=1 Tax=Tundrisphaera sp. TA3 TaxID=3435775 RepID=UPI003EBF1161